MTVNMRATNALREDHRHLRRLEKIVWVCQERLADGYEIPLEDIERMTRIMDGFLYTVHYAVEENAYFPCVAGYGEHDKDIRKLLIEHEFSRRISANISKYLEQWKRGHNSREPIGRFLRTYAIYLKDHMEKEEKFFDTVEESVLTVEEEREMYEHFYESGVDIARLNDMLQDLSYLEGCKWLKE